jgi:hypothetical protein
MAKKKITQERRRLAALRSQVNRDLEESYALVSKLSDLLTRTANALKGKPNPLGSMHSWHDLPEVAARLRRKAEKK